MPAYYAGLDVSLDATSICIIDDTDTPVLQTKVASTPTAIAAALQPYKRMLALVGQETGSLSQHLHKSLQNKRYTMVCIDARKTRAALSAQRNKTDRNDARDIAVLLRNGWYSRTHVKSDEAQRIRLLLTYRTALKHKAHDLHRSIGTTALAFGGRVTRERGRLLIRYERNKSNKTLDDLAKSMMRAYAALLAEVKQLDDLALKLARADPICELLMTVPGVGPLTALTFRAAVDDPHRFTCSRTVAAHFGLTPRRFQSGQYDFKGHISRQGDATVRGMLYEAAFVLLVKVRKKSRLRDWGVRLREEKGFRIACVACARKMAVIMHRMWLTGEPFDPHHTPGLRANSA